jgi:hypothetical protein
MEPTDTTPAPEDSKEFREQLSNFLKQDKEITNPAKKTHRYYTESFAAAARNIINLVVKTKHSHTIKLHGSNPTTAKIQWYQGCKYLKDKLDPEKFYATALVKIGCRVDGDQLFFYIKTSITTDISILTPMESHPWRDNFLIWLDKPGKPMHDKFVCPKVVLSDDDIQWAYERMAGLESLYLFKFTETEVVVIRYSEEKSNGNTT